MNLERGLDLLDTICLRAGVVTTVIKKFKVLGAEFCVALILNVQEEKDWILVTQTTIACFAFIYLSVKTRHGFCVFLVLNLLHVNVINS